jgi:hypothetical protein
VEPEPDVEPDPEVAPEVEPLPDVAPDVAPELVLVRPDEPPLPGPLDEGTTQVFDRQTSPTQQSLVVTQGVAAAAQVGLLVLLGHAAKAASTTAVVAKLLMLTPVMVPRLIRRSVRSADFRNALTRELPPLSKGATGVGPISIASGVSFHGERQGQVPLRQPPLASQHSQMPHMQAPNSLFPHSLSSAAQLLPQLPQLLGSPWRSVQPPPQSVCPDGH